MDSLHSTMNQHVKGKHLSFEERVIIQLRLKDGWSLRAIARELNCSPSTISYEVKRGTVKLYHGKVKRYKAAQGHDAYQAHRKNCGRKSDFLKKTQFIHYVHKYFFEDGWSLDVCSNRATAAGEFAIITTYQRSLNAILSFTVFAKTRKNLAEALKNVQKKLLVYYAHPYTSCDKGTVERHNGLIRRFIPKGEAIANYSLQDIIDIETWCNSLPRKILACHTPDEIFERELDLIYQAA